MESYPTAGADAALGTAGNLTTSPLVSSVARLHAAAKSESKCSLRNCATINRSGVLTSAKPSRLAPARHFGGWAQSECVAKKNSLRVLGAVFPLFEIFLNISL